MDCCPGVDRRKVGLTIVEVLILLLSVGIFVALLLPALTKDGRKAPRVRCTAALKQVALGMLLWANEHENKFPMELPMTEGGTKEHARAGNLLANYTVAAHEIGDARMLLCPSDRKRKPATTFAGLTTANISYFLNVDAAVQNPTNILAGDRDIAISGSAASPGAIQISDPNVVGWASVLHRHGGNVALSDGSVHQVIGGQFRRLLEQTATNRFIIP